MKDFAELDSKTATAKEKFWGGRDLPFPVLLDPSGTTIAQFGIRAFPTMILVDPDGKLVGLTHGTDRLREILDLPAAEAEDG